MEAWLMKRLWYKAKEIWWKAVLGIIFLGALLIYFYRLLKPADDKVDYLEAIKTEATAALKENELRGRLVKDNIGAIKDIFKSRLEDTRKIDDRHTKYCFYLHCEIR